MSEYRVFLPKTPMGYVTESPDARLSVAQTTSEVERMSTVGESLGKATLAHVTRPIARELISTQFRFSGSSRMKSRVTDIVNVIGMGYEGYQIAKGVAASAGAVGAAAVTVIGGAILLGIDSYNKDFDDWRNTQQNAYDAQMQGALINKFGMKGGFYN